MRKDTSTFRDVDALLAAASNRALMSAGTIRRMRQLHAQDDGESYWINVRLLAEHLSVLEHQLHLANRTLLAQIEGVPSEYTQGGLPN